MQIVEGIGLNRITKNLSKALPIIDDAIRSVHALTLPISWNEDLTIS
mgnify:FL=1|jgi:hypothetical protein